MSDSYNATLTSSMGYDTVKINRLNRENAKQNTQTVTANFNMNIKCRIDEGDRVMACKGAFAVQYNDAISV